MGEVDYITLNPVIAYKILPTLSIAAGALLSYSEANFKEYLRPPFTPFTLNNEFRGRDDAAGFNAGILWHPLEQHSFGINYRSAEDMNYNGHSTDLLAPGNIKSQANVHFPQMVAFGYSFRPNKNWNIETDAKWTDYSDLRTVDVNPQAAFGDKLAFNWSPSWMLSLGATRYFGDGWRVSGGLMYSENSVPDADLNPLVPDSDRYIFSLGVGKSYTHFSWDFSYQLAWGPSRSIGTDNFPPADGSYSFLSHALSLNVGYHY
jgi:long-chain fatty acid transport protein